MNFTLMQTDKPSVTRSVYLDLHKNVEISQQIQTPRLVFTYLFVSVSFIFCSVV